MVTLSSPLPLPHLSEPHVTFFLVEPQLLHFNPYTTERIIHIVQDRLMVLNERLGIPIVLFEDSSIELCARKIASICGDIRRVLDVCR
jgi:Cdc6-like AAA superfamily ATPase